MFIDQFQFVRWSLKLALVGRVLVLPMLNMLIPVPVLDMTSSDPVTMPVPPACTTVSTTRQPSNNAHVHVCDTIHDGAAVHVHACTRVQVHYGGARVTHAWPCRLRPWSKSNTRTYL